MKQRLILSAIIFIISVLIAACTDGSQDDYTETEDIISQVEATEISDVYIDDDIDMTEDDIIDISKLSYTEQYSEYGEILIDWSEFVYCEVVEIEVKWFTYEEYKELTEIFGNGSIWMSDNRIRAVNLTPEEEAQRLAEGDPILEGLKNGTWQFGTTGNSIIGGDFICDCCE